MSDELKSKHTLQIELTDEEYYLFKKAQSTLSVRIRKWMRVKDFVMHMVSECQ